MRQIKTAGSFDDIIKIGWARVDKPESTALLGFLAGYTSGRLPREGKNIQKMLDRFVHVLIIQKKTFTDTDSLESIFFSNKILDCRLII